MILSGRVLHLAALLEELAAVLDLEEAPMGPATILPVQETRQLAKAVRHARQQLRGTLQTAGIPAGLAPPKTVADLLKEQRERLRRTTAPPCRRLG